MQYDSPAADRQLTDPMLISGQTASRHIADYKHGVHVDKIGKMAESRTENVWLDPDPKFF